MARERFKLTDEDLKQRWIEWGCEEEIVDQIIARITDETPLGLISEPFVFRHWMTYFDKELCLRIFEMHKSGKYGKRPDHKEYTEEELEELKKEIDSMPEDEFYIGFGQGWGVTEKFREKMIQNILTRFEEEKNEKKG